MSDVFLSYKAEDRARVRPLAAALEAEGLTLWWDAQIEGGAAWRHSIQEQLEAARSVVVVWSKRSVGPEGRFVHDEATRAQRRGVYMPILIDAVEPPLGFGETQALPLTGWRGDRNDPRFQALLSAIQARLDGAPHAAVAPGRGFDRRVLLAGGGAVAAGLAAVGGWAAWRSMRPASDDKSIAVLPFANLSGDASQAYFADGIAEELRSALARIGQLKVIARASCEAVRDKPIKEAAQTLGVSNILTGSVRRSPSLIRVTAQLVGHDGVERWSETYDRAPGDALQIQAGIAENVAQALQVRLGDTERSALAVGGTRNATAHDLFLKSTELSRSDDSEPATRRSLAFLDSALSLDPNYAEAIAGRARALSILAGTYPTDATAFRVGQKQAETEARRAIAVAPRMPSGHYALGNALAAQFDVGGALAEHRRAYALAPDDPGTLKVYGQFLARIGRGEEAKALASQLVALDPLSASSLGSQSLIQFYARRYPEAEDAARRTLQIAPNRIQTQTLLGDILLVQGKTREALATYAKAPADDAFRLTGEAMAAARLGDRAGSDAALARLKESVGDGASYQYGEIHAQRGEIDQAFAALEHAWSVRDGGLLDIRVDPFLDPLRGDPRLKALEKRLNFPA